MKQNVWIRGGTNFHPGKNRMVAHYSFHFKGDDFDVRQSLGSEFFGDYVTLKYGKGKDREYVKVRKPINRISATCIAMLQAMMEIKDDEKKNTDIIFNVSPVGKEIVLTLTGQDGIKDPFYIYYMDRIRAELIKFNSVNFEFKTYEQVDDYFGGKWRWMSKEAQHGQE